MDPPPKSDWQAFSDWLFETSSSGLDCRELYLSWLVGSQTLSRLGEYMSVIDEPLTTMTDMEKWLRKNDIKAVEAYRAPDNFFCLCSLFGLPRIRAEVLGPKWVACPDLPKWVRSDGNVWQNPPPHVAEMIMRALFVYDRNHDIVRRPLDQLVCSAARAVLGAISVRLLNDDGEILVVNNLTYLPAMQ